MTVELESIEKILQLVERFGLSLVLLILLVVLWVIPEVKRLRKKADDIEDVGKRFESTLLTEHKIVSLLNQAVVDLGCQWAIIWQFHNGMLSAARVPFMKMSVTHEATSGGLAPRGDAYQAIPIAVFIEAVVEVIEKGYLSVDLSAPYQSVVNSYRRDGVKYGSFVPLKDTKGGVMGVFSISFAEREEPLTDAEIEKMKCLSIRVSVLLEELADAYKRPRRRMED